MMMNLYSNPCEYKSLKKCIKSRWGLFRIFRKLNIHYPNHERSVLLSTILLSAHAENILYSRRTILRLMNEYDFEPEEKKAMIKWIDGKQEDSKYVYCRDERKPLRQEQQKKVSKEGAEVTSAQNAK